MKDRTRDKEEWLNKWREEIERGKQSLEDYMNSTPDERGMFPSEERRLLKGLRDAIESNGNSEGANYFIDELSTVLSVRNGEYQRSHQTNKWSVPLAVIGLIFTIVFGLMSIFNGPSEEALADKVLERIEQQGSNKSSNTDAGS